MVWAVSILVFIAGYLATTFLFMVADEMVDSDNPWIMTGGLLLHAFIISLVTLSIFWILF